ncbi:hypothetical protein M976_02881 [Buttiauxella ferragutiae ATCC 51602]|uniref:Phage protein n=1 Tax=Buttiauxella ferragutiae ATCC 51602 TaxID=1354252 RepID=A0ABX2W794_9ENTR|nr:DNA-packaging protein FI [Buttiauxella ferragutiae]OAT26720.1 hypothetical protein M976_02881 [Buttiauxella ferragutiae ATCC 51602]
MERKEIIARLNELSGELGREIDITGSSAELALRLREAEEELGAINGDGGCIPEQVVTDKHPDLPMGDRIQVKPSICLHLKVFGSSGYLVSKCVPPGVLVEIASRDFDPEKMTKGG